MRQFVPTEQELKDNAAAKGKGAGRNDKGKSSGGKGESKGGAYKGNKTDNRERRQR